MWALYILLTPSHGRPDLFPQVNELTQNNEHQMRVKELEYKVLHFIYV